MKAVLGVLLAMMTPALIITLLQTRIGLILVGTAVFGGLLVTVIMNIVSAIRISFDRGELPWQAFGKSGLSE
jgi:hypothetical protein